MKIEYTTNNKTGENYIVDPGNGYWYPVTPKRLEEIDMSDTLTYIEMTSGVELAITRDTEILASL